MGNDEYLSSILATQALTAVEEQSLRNLRETVEGQLGQLKGGPRFYYGGSYGKGTLIREHYDLDIVVYWPSDTGYTVKGISEGVGEQLQLHWTVVRPKTVSWELPFEGGFHIDVVPGRAIDRSYVEANLYRRDKDSTLKTSIKTQIKWVRDSGRRDVIRLAKLWRTRRGLDCKTFWLELMVIDGCHGLSSGLESQLLRSFAYLRDSAVTARVLDPANSNNAISDDVPGTTKLAVARAAAEAVEAKYWSNVFQATK